MGRAGDFCDQHAPLLEYWGGETCEGVGVVTGGLEFYVKLENRTNIIAAAHTDIAAHEIDEGLRDCQTEAGAAKAARDRPISLRKWEE